MIEGQPTLLIHDGQVISAHMAREHLSSDEMHRALRQHGIGSHKDVALAVREVDGSISCLKYDDLNPSSHTHLRPQIHPEKRLKTSVRASRLQAVGFRLTSWL